MNRTDGAKFHHLFFEAGLQPYMDVLGASSTEERKASIMAFRPALWGLHVWCSGDLHVLLDEKGFVCSTKNKLLVLALVGFESTHGPGALRTVLSRPLLDPLAAVRSETSRYNPKAAVPAVKAPQPEKSLKRRKLLPAEFAKLLEGI